MPYVTKCHPCTALNCFSKTQLKYEGEYKCFDHNPDKQKARVRKNCEYFKTEHGREIVNRLNRERYHKIKQECVEEERKLMEYLNGVISQAPTLNVLPMPILGEAASSQIPIIMEHSQ